MHATQEKGSVAKKGAKKNPKDSGRISGGSASRAGRMVRDSFTGIPQRADFGMPHGWLSDDPRLLGFFVLQDGFDVDDATPLTRITKGEPEYFELQVRIAGTTTDPACLGCPRRCDAVRASDGGDGAVRWKR